MFSSTLPHRNKALLVFCKESSISKDYLSFEGLKIYHEIAHLNILAIIPSDIHLHLGFIYHYKISTVVKPAKSLNWLQKVTVWSVTGFRIIVIYLALFPCILVVRDRFKWGIYDILCSGQ